MMIMMGDECEVECGSVTIEGNSKEKLQIKEEQQENNIANGEMLNRLTLFTKNITHLKLSDCGLTDFPDEISDSDCITEIDLSKNNLNNLPDSFICFKKLRVIDLSNNHFPKVPEAFFKGLYLIKTLNFSNNKLVLFRKPPCCLVKLHNLDLSSNRLVSPPQWITEELPASLINLDLSHNPCFHLSIFNKDDQSRKVSHLVKTLKLRNVGLRPGYSEKYLLQFTTVTYLDLSNVSVRDQKNCIEGSHFSNSLTHLLLRDNGLGNLPKGVTNLTNLRYLDVSHNLVQWFPPAVKDLTNLVVLHAENCGLFLLPPEMNELKSLKELYLGNNQLTSTDGFDEIITLEVLDLYDNGFITVPKFEKLSRLQAFDFCYNYIEATKLVTLGKRTCSYENLKECFRSKFLHTKTTRQNGAKEFPVISDNNSEFSNCSSEYNNSVYENESDSEYRSTQQSENKNASLETIWDIDCDENFEPRDSNVNLWQQNIIKSSSVESLTGETPHEVQYHPHYFLPYRSVSPVILPPDDLPLPEEGQFDDD